MTARLARLAAQCARNARVPDQAGVAALEFGLIAPVFCVLLLGLFDLGQTVYAKSVLEGAVQRAGRSSSLEAADTSVADAQVSAQVLPVVPNATIKSERKSYFDFADIGRAEAWNDADGNGACGNGETFTDENHSGRWDADIGVSGNGGAGDVVIYTVTLSYRPLFRIPFLPKQWGERKLSASTVRKNQPFSDQTSYGSEAGVCA